MKINYYLTTQSFDRKSYKSLFMTLCGMLNDVKVMENFADENIFYICSDVLKLKIDGDMCLYQLSLSTAIQPQVRDAISTIVNSISHGKDIFLKDRNSEDVIKDTANNSCKECTAILADKSAPLKDKKYGPVYSKKTCIELRRNFWTYYIDDTDQYLEQCRKYYFNLLFHENVDSHIGSIYKECKKQITHALSSLNDSYFQYYVNLGTNLPSQQSQMSWLSSNCNVNACPQGKDKKKLKANFEFYDNNGKLCKIFCGLHIKFDYKDDKTSFSNDRRLYFHEPLADIKNSQKVLIAHIGGHLEQKGFKK